MNLPYPNEKLQKHAPLVQKQYDLDTSVIDQYMYYEGEGRNFE